MKPIQLQRVLLALFLLLPGLAYPETNGFTEWVQLTDLVRELIEPDGSPNHTALNQAFSNPDPFSEEIAKHLRDAAPVFAQIDLLAAQTEWPPMDPETITIENMSPSEVQYIFHLAHLVNLKARSQFEVGEADAAWALIHAFKQCLRYKDENGNSITPLLATGGRMLVFFAPTPVDRFTFGRGSQTGHRLAEKIYR